jgi:transposase
MMTIALDVHTGKTQMVVANALGDIIQEKIIATTRADLRREIGAIQGVKEVIFENGTQSALVYDALQDVADVVVSCDPTQNALIARAEDSCDLRDARRLITLRRAGALKPVYVPAEPHRSLRSLVSYELKLTMLIVEQKNRIKALCRSQGVSCRGQSVYAVDHRLETIEKVTTPAARIHLRSLYRLLDFASSERCEMRREMEILAKSLPIIKRLQSIPGIGPMTARVLYAWIVDPTRFRTRSALNAYAGLGVRQDISNWSINGRAHASRRGQRQVKRALFLAARVAACRGRNAFARRYKARCDAGWEDRKAIRDVARTMLFVVRTLWIHGDEYDDDRVSVPNTKRAG